MAHLRLEEDAPNIVLLCIYITQGLLMFDFNAVLFLGIAVRVSREM